MKGIVALGVCVISFVSLIRGPGAQLSPPAARLKVFCLPSRPLALSVAIDQGLFAKRGVQVEARVAANSEELRSALANGDAEVAHAAVDNAVALKEKTHLDVIVVMGGEGSTNELIAQPGITAVPALRNRTVIVDAPNTAYAIQLKKMLSLRGLEAGRDYEIKPIGGTPQRLAAMREHKEYAASILGPPTSLIAKQEGFVSLGTTSQFLGPYQAVGGFALRPWAEKNREALTAYIAAFVEAQRWILDPENKQPVIALLEKEFKLSEPIAKEAYESWIMARDGFESDARIDREGFGNVLKLREEVEHTWAGEVPAVENYYDGSYFDAALRQIAKP
jgi:ABC-type nitrate/sulfonate/bicarbonate transport system substrate-binding protein